MKKGPLLLLIFVTALVVQLSPAAAWSLPTHYEIVEKTYYALPADVQSKLSLGLMIKGASDPDLKFLDYQHHKYPANQAKVNYWLNRGNIEYKSGNYDDASYCFGVASHYISDGCCAPHCMDNASPFYHFIYELRALLLTPEINKSSGDINLIMKNNYLEGKDSWQSWINSKNNIYIQNDLNRAVDASFISINERIS